MQYVQPNPIFPGSVGDLGDLLQQEAPLQLQQENVFGGQHGLFRPQRCHGRREPATESGRTDSMTPLSIVGIVFSVLTSSRDIYVLRKLP